MKLPRLVAWNPAILWAALVAPVIVLLLRCYNTITFKEPYLGFTSGCEEEALFSIWKAANSHDVFTDPWSPPFSGSYFGWLFYASYGLVIRTLNFLFSLSEIWLPTIARLGTLTALGLCAWKLNSLLKEQFQPRGEVRPSTLLALALITLFNPLFHWWSITARPDLWALTFEVFALGVACKYTSNRKPIDLLTTGIFIYIAWSFRPTNLSVLIGFSAWMLRERDFKNLLIFYLGLIAAFSTTIIALGKNYIENVFIANALSGDFITQVAISNAYSALTKNPWLAVCIILCVPIFFKSSNWFYDPLLRLHGAVALISVPLCLTFSSKVGASSNYFFPVAVFLPLFLVLFLARGTRDTKLVRRALLAGSILTSVCSLAILLGFSGKLTPDSDTNLVRIRNLRGFTNGPVLCTERSANLPWILGHGSKSFVFGYAYPRMLIKKPDRFRNGTLDSLVQEGAFESIIHSKNGAAYIIQLNALEAYSVIEDNETFTVFRKNIGISHLREGQLLRR